MIVTNIHHCIKTILSAIRIKAGVPMPLKVTHCITWKCNLSCNYCSRHHQDNELNSADILKMMDMFSKAGTLYWSFNGGEPLMRKDIAELARHAKKRGMHVSLATNGTLLEERRDVLNYVDVVNVSVEGPKPVHDRMRSNSFDKMLTGLEILRRRGIRTTFTTVLSKNNADVLESVLDLAEAYRAKVYFQPIRVQKEDISGKSIAFFPELEKIRKAIDYLISRKNNPCIASSRHYLLDIKAHWPDKMTLTPCFAGRAYCFVTPMGQVTACCDTLAVAGTSPATNALQNGAMAFRCIPNYSCRTCFPAIPLETNILFHHSWFNALSQGGKIMKWLSLDHKSTVTSKK